MDVNDSETVNQANATTSVFYCWYFPTFAWELGETTLPWVIFSITVVASPVTVLLNVLDITAVRRKKQLQRVSTVLLCSMAVADVLVGAVSMPLTAAVDLLIAHQTWLDNICLLDFVGVTVTYCACWTALSHLTVIAWERLRGNHEMEGLLNDNDKKLRKENCDSRLDVSDTRSNTLHYGSGWCGR